VIHAFLGPFSFASTLSGSNQVGITVDTLYPFGNTLTYTISAQKSFAFKIRVPTWAQNSTASTIAVNNGKATALSPDATSLHTVNVKAGKTSLTVKLNAPLEIEVRSAGAVAINRGALNFVVEIPYNDTVTPGLRSAQAIPDVERLYPNAPPRYLTPFDNHTQDHTLLPQMLWNLAIDPKSIVVSDKSANLQSVPYYAWAPGSSPVTMTATACEIEWGLTTGVASAPPQSPNNCVGEHFKVNLVPYGAAKLRLGEIPVMSV